MTTPQSDDTRERLRAIRARCEKALKGPGEILHSAPAGTIRDDLANSLIESLDKSIAHDTTLIRHSPQMMDHFQTQQSFVHWLIVSTTTVFYGACALDIPFLLDLIDKQQKALKKAIDTLQNLVKPLGEPHHSHSDSDLIDMLQHFNLSMKVDAKEALTAIEEILSK